MTENELELLHRYLDNTIAPEDMDSLEHLLRTSAAARSTLRSLATLDTKCRQLAADVPIKESTQPASRLLTTHSWLYPGAVVLALLFGIWGWLHDSGGVKNGVARVIRIEGPNQQFSRGHELQNGESIEIEDGLIEMAFHETGVHILATAPLKLRIDSEKRVFLHEGEVKLHVPPQGVGFIVDTLDRQITDLGTSFVVTTREKGSKVLVLDGQIAVADRNGGSEQLMTEGELASFDQNGEIKLRSREHSGVPELPLQPMTLSAGSLPGLILGFEDLPSHPRNGPRLKDYIGAQIMPLIESGFRDRSCLVELKKGRSLRFSGIAGTYNQFPDRTGLVPYAKQMGWIAWYQGRAVPPQPGRYRFWGYADNQLLVAINGKPVLDGSRYDSAFHNRLSVPGKSHPSWPCLNASAGFASGPWIEIGNEPVQIDILFGEIFGNQTSGLLLVEREGANYEDTFWGQPKWPLFLTEPPGNKEKADLDKLRLRMEEKLMGSFSISDEAVWKVYQ